MSTATVQKLKNEIKKELIAEFLLPLLECARDSEGGYNPKFIKEIMKATKEKPLYRYNSKTFLKLLS